jgi:hypothetical protein
MDVRCGVYRDQGTGDLIVWATTEAGRCCGVMRVRRPYGAARVLPCLRLLMRRRPTRARVQSFFRSAKAWAIASGEIAY